MNASLRAMRPGRSRSYCDRPSCAGRTTVACAAAAAAHAAPGRPRAPGQLDRSMPSAPAGRSVSGSGACCGLWRLGWSGLGGRRLVGSTGASGGSAGICSVAGCACGGGAAAGAGSAGAGAGSTAGGSAGACGGSAGARASWRGLLRDALLLP